MAKLRPLLALALAVLVAVPTATQDAPEQQPEAKPPLPLFFHGDELKDGDPLSGGVHELVSLLFDRLYHWVPTEFGPQLRPSLAKAMPEYSTDGLTASIALRKDIAFNGIEEFGDRQQLRVRAQDVVANVKACLKFDKHRAGLADALCTYVKGCAEYRELARQNSRWTRADLRQAISGLECKDDFTLVVTLNKPTRMLPVVLAHPGMVVWPAEAFAEGRRDIKDEWVQSATGPYWFETDAFERNPGYRGEPAEVPEFDFEPEGRNSAPAILKERWATQKSGYWHLGGSHTELFFASEPDPSVVITRAEELHYLAFNMQDPIWGRADEHGRGLRNTVFHALDPAAILKDLNKSGPFLAADGPLPEIRGFASPWNATDWKPLGAEEARKLLRTTKYAAGQNPDDGAALQLRILCPDPYFARLFAAQFEPLLVKAGIGALVEAAASSSDFLNRITKGDFHAVYYGWRNDWPDHADMLLRLHSRHAQSDAVMSVPCRLANKDLDALLDLVEATDPLDRERRLAAIRKATDWLATHRPYVPLVSPANVNLVGTDILMPELPWSAGNTVRFIKRK